MKDDHFTETRFLTNNDHSKIGSTDRLTSTPLTKKYHGGLFTAYRHSSTPLTSTTDQKDVRVKEPGRQVFLLPPHGKHIAAALRDGHKELTLAHPLTENAQNIWETPHRPEYLWK